MDQAALVGQTVGWTQLVKQTQTEGHDHRDSGFRVLGHRRQDCPPEPAPEKGCQEKKKEVWEKDYHEGQREGRNALIRHCPPQKPTSPHLASQ